MDQAGPSRGLIEALSGVVEVQGTAQDKSNAAWHTNVSHAYAFGVIQAL